MTNIWRKHEHLIPGAAQGQYPSMRDPTLREKAAEKRNIKQTGEMSEAEIREAVFLKKKPIPPEHTERMQDAYNTWRR